MATTKAAVVTAPNQLSWQDVPEPPRVGPRPVRLRVGAVGVCGSDVLRFAHGTAYHYPLVLGHEFSAVVEEAPADSRFRTGDKVAVFPLIPRADDPMTQVGEWALGEDYDYFGSRRDGAMTEVLWAPEANLVPVPPEVPLAHAAVVEPAAVALHAVRKLAMPAAGTAVVVGSGPIGALAAQWLRILGWSRVVVADVDPRKLAIMERMGFETVDAARQDTVAAVKELTDGRGADATVEASGLPQTLLQCVDAAAAQGQVLVLGDLKGDVTFARAQISSFIRRELVLVGTWNSKVAPTGRSEWDTVVRAITDGALQVEPLISHRPALSEAASVLADVAAGRTWSNKVVFLVSAQARAEVAAAAAEVTS